ncbi:MBL fold metallo-hydrolase [Thermoleophilia bacterium SCSIO 60948]|nr:MBL fold metallo-hydrolase [Thermoleophilia bacterium SCSIO 60948]
MTGRGTNTYVIAGETGGCIVIDPGPAIGAHLDAIRDAAAGRGGIKGVLLTHSHSDHAEAVEPLGEPLLWPLPGVLAERSEAELETPAGPIRVVPTPGHAADHVCFVAGGIGFGGDAVLGEGSSIVPPRSAGGSLGDYMRSLDVLDALELDLLLPGHGPAITDPRARIDEYRAHRLGRERDLLAALGDGVRERGELLDAAWSDVPEAMRPAADVALQAHLEKLSDEGRLPFGVEGPLFAATDAEPGVSARVADR